MENTRKKRKLIPVNKWNEHHDWPPIGGLRHLIFHAKSNGFNSVICRVGRRVLIDEEAFFAWIESEDQRKKDHSESKFINRTISK